MKKEAFLVSEDDQVLAALRVPCSYRSGQKVAYSFRRCREGIDANRSWNLVNAKEGKISYDLKNLKKWTRSKEMYFATEINEKEFYIEIDH
jgi:hypothetical protein